MRKLRKLNNIFTAAAAEHYMRTNNICKYAYRKLIDAELPKNSNGDSFFDMYIETSGDDFFIKVRYYDHTDERYFFSVGITKEYIIPVEEDNVELYKYLRRHGIRGMKYCFESSTKSDAECTVRCFDNMFTQRCREEKIKFSGYGEYKYWRKAYIEFLCEITEKYDSSFLKNL